MVKGYTDTLNCILAFSPDKKVLARTILKALTADKSNVTLNMEFVFHRVENIVEKGETTGSKMLSTQGH